MLHSIFEISSLTDMYSSHYNSYVANADLITAPSSGVQHALFKVLRDLVCSTMLPSSYPFTTHRAYHKVPYIAHEKSCFNLHVSLLRLEIFICTLCYRVRVYLSFQIVSNPLNLMGNLRVPNCHCLSLPSGHCNDIENVDRVPIN